MPKKELIRIYNNYGVLIKKQCGKCGEIKNIEEFNKDKGKKDGLRTQCKLCDKNSNKKYYTENKNELCEKAKINYDNNKEKKKEYQKEYKANNKEKVKETNKKYRESHKKEIRKWYEENPNKVKEWKKIYYEHNKEKVLKKNRDYYYRKTQESINEIYENYTKQIYPNNGVQYGIIYGVFNKATNEYVYIGQTQTSFESRYKGDFFKYKMIEYIDENNEKLQIFKQDLEKYGEDSFEFHTVIDIAFSPMELDALECLYIDKYNTYKNGWNSNRGFINGRDTLYEKWMEENIK